MRKGRKFEEMQFQYDFSFDEIKFYVSHLMKWQKTVIINSLSKYSTFTLDPKFVFKSGENNSNPLPEKYRNEYSNMIKSFEEPKTLEASLDQKGPILEIGIIIKLLQMDIIKECNRYVYLKVNKEFIAERFLQKNFDFNVFKSLKKYSMKRSHIHEIAWKEDINLRDIINVLMYCDSLGSYYI